MEHPLKVTTPLLSDWLHPLIVAPEVPELMDNEMVEWSVKATLPKTSSTVSAGWSDHATPPVPPLG